MSRSGRIPINIPENTEIKVDNGIITAKGKLGELSFNFGKDAKVSIDDKSDIFNTEFIEMLELKNLLDNAMATIHSANFRKESRGAHSHDDYPERNDDEWLVHTLAYLKDDNIYLKTREVIRDVLDDEVESVPLAKRVY